MQKAKLVSALQGLSDTVDTLFEPYEEITISMRGEEIVLTSPTLTMSIDLNTMEMRGAF